MLEHGNNQRSTKYFSILFVSDEKTNTYLNRDLIV